MNPWAQAILVIAVTAAAIALGRLYFSRSYNKAITGALTAIGWIAFLLTAHLIHVYTLYGGLDWIAASRSKYIMIAFAVCLGLISPLKYLDAKWKQVSTVSVLAVFLVLFVGLPFVGPAVFQHQIQQLPTQLDPQGLCYQSRSYTCGPAAAVTALNQLGLEAAEAQIARAAGTAPWLGTCPWDLYRALDRMYPEQDLQCRYERFRTVDQLPTRARTLVIMREGFLLDHCVTILNVTRTEVLVADPTTGLRSIPRPAFEAAWRHTGIVLSRPQLSKALP